MDELEKLLAEKEAEVRRLRRQLKQAKAPPVKVSRPGEEAAKLESAGGAFAVDNIPIVSIEAFRSQAKMKAWGAKRPTNYFRDCIERPRPCPWVGCKYHLLVDVTSNGALSVNAGPRSTRGSVPGVRSRSPTKKSAEELVTQALYDSLKEGWPPTCALDVAEQARTATLEEIAQILNVSRERIRQLQAYALEVLREAPAQRVFKAWRGELGPGKSSESDDGEYAVPKRRRRADAAD